MKTAALKAALTPCKHWSGLNVEAYGAFTVGILVERDRTTLEVDLADIPTAPKRFREQ
jgi:hypothetical protein